MTRPSARHRCRSCAAISHRWAGRCAACGEWNSLEALPDGPGLPESRRAAPVPLGTVDLAAGRPSPTGIGEVDRVLSGGLLAGSVTLVFGEPGVGKSTLLLQVLIAAAGRERTVLLVSAEESAAQVRVRGQRLGAIPDSLYVSATADLDEALAAVADIGPDLVVVDSVQTVVDREVAGPPGSPLQVRACVDRLTRLAKDGGPAVVLVGQVTKEGGPAGPRALEHLVDTVLGFEGDRHHSLRLLRAVKHRFGPTGEVGLFEMGDNGLAEVGDPGPLLLGDRRPEVPGSAVVPVLQGRRPLLVEVQALALGGLTGGSRQVQGIDQRRLGAVAAVLECRAGLDLGRLDLFVSAAGGVRAAEPAVDLPVALALASAVVGRAVPGDLVSFGEVGLAGEVRQVTGPGHRLAEAARLGFTRALVPASTTDGPPGLSLLRVRTVAEALELADLVGQAVTSRRRARPATRQPTPPDTMPPWSTTATR